MAPFELVAQEWKQAERRAAGLPAEQRPAVDRVVDELVKELRRRLGGPFSVDELVTLYDAGTSWCTEIAYAIAPGAPWAWDPPHHRRRRVRPVRARGARLRGRAPRPRGLTAQAQAGSFVNAQNAPTGSKPSFA